MPPSDVVLSERLCCPYNDADDAALRRGSLGTLARAYFNFASRIFSRHNATANGEDRRRNSRLAALETPVFRAWSGTDNTAIGQKLNPADSR